MEKDENKSEVVEEKVSEATEEKKFPKQQKKSQNQLHIKILIED